MLTRRIIVARKDSLDNKYVVDSYNKLKNDDNVVQGRGESFKGNVQRLSDRLFRDACAGSELL